MAGTDGFNSVNVRHQYDAFYGRTDFVRFPRSERAFVKAVIRHYHVVAGAKVADLGCGTGKYARLFAESGCNVLAMDVSEVAIRHTRTVAPQALAVVGDLRYPPCADGQFDVVFASGVSLFNTRDLADVGPVVRQFCSLLRPGGVIIFVKTSSLTDRLSKRGSRMDYRVETFESAFAVEPGLRKCASHALFPQLFAVLGTAAFAGVVTSISMAMTRAFHLPLRVYLIYEKHFEVAATADA